MKRAAAVLVAASLVASGCRTVLETAPVVPPGGETRPAVLLERLALQADERRSLRGLARLAMDGPEGAGRARQVLVVERPARLRVEVQGFLNQTLAVLVTDGDRYDFFRAQDRYRATGPVRPTLLWELARLPLTPREAVGVLLGTPLPVGDLRVLASSRLEAGGTRVDLGIAPEEILQRYEFDADGRLRRAARHANVAGGLLWEARYDDYRDVAGTSFAHLLDIRFPLAKAQAEVRFGQVELNPELPHQVFQLSVPPTSREGEGASG